MFSIANHGHQEARAEVLASTWAERIEGFMKGGSAATFRKTEREREERAHSCCNAGAATSLSVAIRVACACACVKVCGE